MKKEFMKILEHVIDASIENVDSVLTVLREDTISFVEDFKYYGE